MTIERIAARITRSDAGLWRGQVVVVRDSKTHGVEVTVDERAIREELARDYMPPGASSGSIFSKLGKWLAKTAQKIARWKVWKAIGNVVKKVVNSPVVAGIVGVASVIFPPIGATYAAAKTALNVVDGVTRGDPRVVANLAKVGKAALANNPIAAQAISAVKAAEKSPLAQFVPT